MQTKKLIALLSVVATFDETSARVTDSNETQELRLADSSPATDAKHSGEVQLLQMDDTDALETREERAPPRKPSTIPGLPHSNLLPEKAISKDAALLTAKKVIKKATASEFMENYKQHVTAVVKEMDACLVQGNDCVKNAMVLKLGLEENEWKYVFKPFVQEWKAKFAPKITEADQMLQKNIPQDIILKEVTADTSAFTLEEKERLTACIKQFFKTHDKMRLKFTEARVKDHSNYDITKALFEGDNIVVSEQARRNKHIQLWLKEWESMNGIIDWLLLKNESPSYILKAVKPSNEHFSSEQDKLLLGYISKRSDDYHNMIRKKHEAPLVVPPLVIFKKAVFDHQVSSISDLERFRKRLSGRPTKSDVERPTMSEAVVTKSEAEVTKKLMDWLDKSETEVLERLRAPTSNVPEYLIDHYFQKFKNLRAEMAAYHQKWSQEKLSPSAVSAMENLSNAAKDDPKVRYYDLYKSPGSEIAT